MTLTPPPVVDAGETAPDLLRGLVLRAQSGFFWVETESGVIECRLRGRLKKERQSADICVIGDEVELERVDPAHGAITAVLPRHSKLSRRQPGPRGIWKEDVLVANLDQMLAVFACARPEPNPRTIDRFLVVAEYNRLEVALVANKADLVAEQDCRSVYGVYEHIGYPVYYTSKHWPASIEQLRERLSRRLSVLTGPSGVGKSSLINAIQPGLLLRTGEVSAALDKGRHTTTVAELHRIAGGYVADTPGIRELGFWRIPLEELAWCFRELRPLLGGCYFAGCTHVHEPGCAVREALEAGQIDPQRYESYLRLRTDAA
jgi:ribosome biogenesis GTPase / thiamine phosphate phosphatase